MRYILIPVKDLSYAKQRLASLMTQQERTRLAWEMLRLTFDAVSRVRRIDRIAVVTNYPAAAELARRYGMEVIEETDQVSESVSVDFGSGEIERKGAVAALRLPIDLPLVTTPDIERILECDVSEPSVIIVPSRDGSGTNAMLRRPPTLFPSHFGPRSLEKHLRQARLLNVCCEVIEIERIGLDIDEPGDIIELLKRDEESPIRSLLLEMAIDERIRIRA